MWVDYNDIKPAFEDNVPIVYKGSICLAGVSLTVAELKDSQVRVSLIPHTLSHTILGKLAEGDKINVEFDHDMLLSDRHNTWVAPSDDEFMKRAVQCGDKGRITAPPNPWVGCVIVASDGVNVIGEGYHRKAGEPHAEINALQDAVARGYGSTIKGSTVYVTLEPCHHTGRTPPCDMELVKQGVGRVVIALLDPDKRVCGMGAQHLRDSGIAVVVGVGAELAHKSLEPYLHHRTTGIPYCLLKVALSLDAKIACADNTSQWITGSAARLHAHKLRSESQALIVGSRTAGVDQPQLTVRLPDVNAKPLRVVLDTRGVIHTGPLMDTSLAPTLIFHGPQVSKSVIDKWSKKGVESCCVATTPAPDVRLDLHAVMVELGRRGFLQVMVEGGAEVHSHFIKEKLVDEMVIYFGACILGSSAQPWARTEITKTIGDVEFMRLQDVEKFGNDVALIYKRANSPATVVKH
jgi:diaminohydroxyphosphoribosylaminopyrimidine deaminase/5-amino-6-(5-phosphoribosylamino)uracil reductase